MLAGHPDLFAAAELQLLGFNTLDERRMAFSGKFSLWLEGTIRTIMEIKGCEAEEARHIMADYERHYTTKQFYQLLQEWIGNQTLVDKSPSYVLDLSTLEKAERDFDNALYIHLVRHPYAMVRSFEAYHMDQVLFLRDHPFSARQLGELIWVVSQQNTVEFLRKIPKHRQYRMRFEDLVSRPRAIMEALCETLRLEFHPGLVEPYKDMDKKMINGIYPDSTPMGDTKLLQYRGIEPKAAETWKQVVTDNFLSDITWELASSLGYEPPSAVSTPTNDSLQAWRQTMSSRRELLERRRHYRQQRFNTAANDEELQDE
jgi:hypothetical protein